MAKADDNALGGFLRAARGRVQPEQAGLPVPRSRRRLPGLRREEVALLAGVGVSYYTRIEQGQARNLGTDVLTAIADTLHLSTAERDYLRTLVSGSPRPRAKGGRAPAGRRVPQADPGLVQLMDAAPQVPALVLGRNTDVLAWNTAGRRLLAPHVSQEAVESAAPPNMAAMVFLDPPTRDLYVDWRRKAQAVVGNLRISCAGHPEDEELARLVGSLGIRSGEFAALWQDHRIEPCAAMDVELRHPRLGTFTVLQQSLRSGASPEQVLVTHTAPRGSAGADALALISHLQGERTGVPPIR